MTLAVDTSVLVDTVLGFGVISLVDLTLLGNQIVGFDLNLDEGLVPLFLDVSVDLILGVP